MLKIHWQDTYLTNSKNLPMGGGRPTCNRVLTSGSVGMGIPMGIPVGMGWVWGLKCHPHGSPGLFASGILSGVIFVPWHFVPTEANPLEPEHPRRIPARYFTAISSSSMRTVADRYRLAAYYSTHCWWRFLVYQRRWPWTTLNPRNRVF